jgi:DNA-binding MarR family transcriptional regulator
MIGRNELDPRRNPASRRSGAKRRPAHAEGGGSAQPDSLGRSGRARREPSVANLVMLASRLFARALHARLEPHGVAPGQLAVLRRLWEEDGLTQASLARETRVEQPTMARTLDRMARDGLIERVASPHDRRAFNVRLTRRGKQLRRAIGAEAAGLDRVALTGLSEAERRKLGELLRRLAASLRKATALD